MTRRQLYCLQEVQNGHAKAYFVQGKEFQLADPGTKNLHHKQAAGKLAIIEAPVQLQRGDGIPGGTTTVDAGINTHTSGVEVNQARHSNPHDQHTHSASKTNMCKTKGGH